MLLHYVTRTSRPLGFGDIQTPVFCVQLSVPGPDGSFCRNSGLCESGSLCSVLTTRELPVGLEPANYRHSGFQALVDLALLASDQQGSDGLALGRPAAACFLRGLYRLPHINKPATPEAGAETCAN